MKQWDKDVRQFPNLRRRMHSALKDAGSADEHRVGGFLARQDISVGLRNQRPHRQARPMLAIALNVKPDFCDLDYLSPPPPQQCLSTPPHALNSLTQPAPSTPLVPYLTTPSPNIDAYFDTYTYIHTRYTLTYLYAHTYPPTTTTNRPRRHRV